MSGQKESDSVWAALLQGKFSPLLLGKIGKATKTNHDDEEKVPNNSLNEPQVTVPQVKNNSQKVHLK